ncbi:hypothetical protein L0F63_004950 [Massospora cicadina]|nr:hypothetical protein L0F63_004950 [Massospora cicadina]
MERLNRWSRFFQGLLNRSKILFLRLSNCSEYPCLPHPLTRQSPRLYILNAQELNFSRLLHLTAHAWRQAIDRRMKDNGLSMSSWMAVATIALQEAPISQKRAGAGAGVVPLIDRLVKQQLVERVQPAEDRRKRLLHVTAQGNDLYLKLKIEADNLRAELLADINHDELAITQRVLQRLRNKVRGNRPDPFAPREWGPGEKPMLPGSPSTPLHPTHKRIAFGIIGLLIAITGALSNALVTANLTNLQGVFGAYSNEIAWLPAVYVMGNISINLLLVKFRQQFGLRVFTEAFLVLYVLVSFFHLLVNDLSSAIVVRAAHGMVAAALSSLGIYYQIQAWPAKHRLKALTIGMCASQLAIPLARLFSSELLQLEQWRGLYLFELGLAMICLGAVLVLKLPPGDRIKVFEKKDFLTFILMAPGMALFCGVLSLGRIEWWTSTPWLGICLALGLVLVIAAVLVEHNRSNPLINTRWLRTGAIFSTGDCDDHAARDPGGAKYRRDWLSAAGGIAQRSNAGSGAGHSCRRDCRNNHQCADHQLMSLLLIMIASLMDAQSSPLTRANNMYFSQFLLGFSSTFFIAPALLLNIGSVVTQPKNLVSLVVLFGMSQNLGGLMGSALLGTFQVWREKYHSSLLSDQLSYLNTNVTDRLAQYATLFNSYIGDSALRAAEGTVQLQTAATLRANVLAYNDTYLLTAGMAFVTLIWYGEIMSQQEQNQLAERERTNQLRILSIAFGAGIAVVGVLIILYAWQLPPFTSQIQSTENAYVRGQVTFISPQVSGYVTAVNALDYQPVHKGDVLMTIDDRIYKQRVHQAQAQVAMKKAALANNIQQRRSAAAVIERNKAALDNAKAQAIKSGLDLKRVENLTADGSLSVRERDASRASNSQTVAEVQQAKATLDVSRQDLQTRMSPVLVSSLELAQIDLDNTRIIAPRDGRLCYRRDPPDFSETQMARIRAGLPVSFTVDALDGESFRGEVEYISPAANSEFSAISPDNATGNFVKIAQRIPVRIKITSDNAAHLRPGEVMRWKRALLAVTLAVTLAGCATEVEKAPGSLPVPSQWRNQVGPSSAVEADWWRAFGDEDLNRLVEQALRNNLDILTARSRVDLYRAQLRADQGDNFPTLDAGVAASHARALSSVTGQPYEYAVFQGLLQANYDVDLWGARSSSIDAAKASLDAVKAASSAAELTVASSVASGYMTLISLDEQLRVTQATLASRENSLKLAQRQYATGYSSKLEWVQSQSEYQTAKAQIPVLQHQIVQQEMR